MTEDHNLKQRTIIQMVRSNTSEILILGDHKHSLVSAELTDGVVTIHINNGIIENVNISTLVQSSAPKTKEDK